MFDNEQGFAELADLWPNKMKLPAARQLYDALVNGDEAEACHRALVEAARGDSMRGMTRTWTLGSYLSRKHHARLPEVAAPLETERTAREPRVRPSSPPPRVDAFERWWSARPLNYGAPESRADALASYQAAVHRHGLEFVERALAVFIRIETLREYPRHLSTLLDDDDQLRTYAEHPSITPEQERAFDVCWREFRGGPIATEHERIAKIGLFLRVIDDPLAFYASIKRYNYECKRDQVDDRYRVSWSTFVNSLNRTIQNGGALADLIHQHCPMVRPHLGTGHWSSVKAAADGIKRANDWSPYGRRFWVNLYTPEQRCEVETRPGFRWAKPCERSVTEDGCAWHEDCATGLYAENVTCPHQEEWFPHEIDIVEETPEEIAAQVWAAVCAPPKPIERVVAPYVEEDEV